MRKTINKFFLLFRKQFLTRRRVFHVVVVANVVAVAAAVIVCSSKLFVKMKAGFFGEEIVFL